MAGESRFGTGGQTGKLRQKNLRIDVRTFGDMAEIGKQPVGNVDRRIGQFAFAQGQTQFDTRQRSLQRADATLGECFRQFRPRLQLRESQRGEAGLAGHPKIVAQLRAVTAQGTTAGDFAQSGEAQVERPARRVAADKIRAVTLGAGEKAVGKGGNPRFVGLWQTTGEQHPARPGAHRRQIGQIHRQRFPAELEGIGVRQEVRAGDEHVGRNCQFHAGGGRQQGAIVTGSKHRLRRRTDKVTVNQVKFGRHRKIRSTPERAGCGALGSSGCAHGLAVCAWLDCATSGANRGVRRAWLQLRPDEA